MRDVFVGRFRARRLVAAGFVALVTIFFLSPTGCYLSRAGWEEARILKRRKPIEKIVQDAHTDSVTRAKLRLVLDARRFAVDSVGLAAKKSFTTFTKLDHDTLVLVLSAAYKDQLRFHTWWFPIVGRVPYKGYFDYKRAKRDAQNFEKRGYDVVLRPSAAFSTLGWFNDPLLSTTLAFDTLSLANTVIHELTHNTFFAPGQVIFNESFANFVGARGAAWFYRSRGQTTAAERVDAEWEDDKLLGAFWTTLYHSIDSAFKAHPNSREERLVARDTLYARARQQLVYGLGPKLHTIGPRVLERVRLDNAAVMARRIYLTDLDVFDSVYVREGRDLRRTVKRIGELAKQDKAHPFNALRRAVGLAPVDTTGR